MSERAARFEQHARWYAELAWATIPVNGKKAKPTSWETTQPDEPGVAAGKWSAWGERWNMGVVCGSSGLAIVDVDHADAESVYLERFGGLPDTPIVRTGRDRRLQVYFRDPGGLDRTAIDGVDLRVGPHMCVLPPSEHPITGRAYEWLDGHEPWAVELAPLPPALLDYFGADRQNGKAPATPIGDVIPIGSIDDTLASLAGTMRHRGFDEEAIYVALVATLPRCELGHTHTEKDCRRIAKSISRYAPERSASIGGTHPGTHPVSPGAEGGVSATASLRPYVVEDAVTGTHPVRFEFATAEEFAAVTEESADVLLGDEETGAAIAAGGTGITYGDGGAGKTTLELDRALHLVTGTTWLGLSVPRKLKVLIVENDGPRGPFRKKIKKKLETWTGPDPKGRLHVLEDPWGEVNIAREDHRQALAGYICEHEIEMLLAGPIVSLGMVGGGTPDEVAAFESHVRALRALLDRPLVVWLIHHENTSGRISGAWGRVPDTQLHVTSTGNGKTRVFWDKARWSPVLHKSTWKLKWAEGESFELDETAEATEEQIAESILDAARAHPGESWNTLDAEVTGKGQTKRMVRDRLIADGALLNTSEGKRSFELWAADDPAAQRGETS